MVKQEHMNGTSLNLSDFLPYRFSVLSNQLSRAIANEYEQRFDLSIPEWRVMAIIGETPDLSANQVAELSAMDKVAVSRAVAKLIKAKRVKRRFAADDKRRSLLALTAKGKSIYESVIPIAKSFERDILARLDDEERQFLDKVLTKLTLS